MNTLNYQQARSKILDAYFKDEIKPLDAKFCFCGTLSPDENWYQNYTYSEVSRPYTYFEYERMEKALFSVFPKLQHEQCGVCIYMGSMDQYLESIKDVYEEVLFKGMCNALDELKAIHQEKGENTDEPTPVFTKRKLVGA